MLVYGPFFNNMFFQFALMQCVVFMASANRFRCAFLILTFRHSTVIRFHAIREGNNTLRSRINLPCYNSITFYLIKVSGTITIFARRAIHPIRRFIVCFVFQGEEYICLLYRCCFAVLSQGNSNWVLKVFLDPR